MGAKSGPQSTESPPPADGPLARLLLTPPPLSGEDEVNAAAASLRSAGLDALPVLLDGRPTGMVTARELLGPLSQAGANGPVRCADIARPFTPVPVTMPADEALWMLQRDGIDPLIVVDEAGGYLGLLTRSRLLEALCDARRPRLIGGLATPFGVHLCSPHQRGGVNDLAIVATGLMIGLLAVAAQVIVALALALLSPDAHQAALGALSYRLVELGAVPDALGGIGGQLAVALCFLLLLRLSPLAGFHAAEHQAVHAVERGIALTPEQLSHLPRPHPRCGTNLVVLLALLLVGYAAWRAPWPQNLWLGPALLGLLAWRRLGRWVQQQFTTKPASRRQLEAGLAAARLLLARHQRAPELRAGLVRRVWNRGLVQVLFGLLLSWQVVEWLSRLGGWLVT